MGRIFKVWVNLDEMCAQLDLLNNDAETAQWLRGFRIGSRGGRGNETISAATASGISFGLSAHMEAMAYSAKQSAKAKLRHSHGSATAGQRHSHGSANPTSNIQHPISNSEHPTTHAEETNAFDIGPAQPVSSEDRWRYEKNQPWAQAVITAGGKVGPQNWLVWKELLVRFPLEKMLPVIRSLPAEDRWPDRTETALRAHGGQVPIGEAVKYKIRKITNE